jgi:hypothetical protein
MKYFKSIIFFLIFFYLSLNFSFSQNYDCQSDLVIGLRNFEWNNLNKNQSLVNKCWSNSVRWPQDCNEYYEIINNWWELSITWYYLTGTDYLTFSGNSWDILSGTTAFSIGMITNWLPNSLWYSSWICWWTPWVNWTPNTYYTYWVTSTGWTLPQYLTRQDYYNPDIGSQVAMTFGQYYWTCWAKTIAWPTVSNNINWNITQIFETNFYWNNVNWYVQSSRVNQFGLLEEYYDPAPITLPTGWFLSWSELTIWSKFWKFNWYLKKLIISKSAGQNSDMLYDLLTNCSETQSQYCNEKTNYPLLYSSTWSTLLLYSWSEYWSWLTPKGINIKKYPYKVMRCWIDDYIADSNNNLLIGLSWSQFKQINWATKTTYYIIWSGNSIYLDFWNFETTTGVYSTWQVSSIPWYINNCTFDDLVNRYDIFWRLWTCFFGWIQSNVTSTLDFANTIWNLTNLNQTWYNSRWSWASSNQFANVFHLDWYLAQIFYFWWFLFVFIISFFIIYFSNKK